MKWQLLVLTMPERHAMLTQLMEQFDAQFEAIPIRKLDRVEVVVQPHTGGLDKIGEAREKMRRESTAEYINFVDDDDLVAPDYIPAILEALERRPDQVGFQVQPYMNGTKIAPTFHTLKSGFWYEDVHAGKVTAFHRDISHICPMRRELALQVPMSGGFGEDHRWADAMRATGIVKTETYIDRVMYYYLIREPKQDRTDAQLKWRTDLYEKISQPEIRRASSPNW